MPRRVHRNQPRHLVPRRSQQTIEPSAEAEGFSTADARSATAHSEAVDLSPPHRPDSLGVVNVRSLIVSGRYLFPPRPHYQLG
jgi:hypothetical protein